MKGRVMQWSSKRYDTDNPTDRLYMRLCDLKKKKKKEKGIVLIRNTDCPGSNCIPNDLLGHFAPFPPPHLVLQPCSKLELSLMSSVDCFHNIKKKRLI